MSNALTRFANSFIHQNVTDESTVVELTVEREGRVASGTTANTSDAALDALIGSTLEAAAASPVSDLFAGFAPAAAVAEVDHYDESTANATPEDRARMVAAFVDAGQGFDAAGFCDTIAVHSAVATTEGQRVSGSYTRAVIDGIHRSGTVAGSAHQASSRLGDLDGAAAGAQAASKARAAAEPFDLKPGRYEVVLEPNASGTICVFLAAYGFNGMAVMEGRSFAEIGADLFDPAVTLQNDPLHPNAIGLAFDNEGTPSRTADLVDAGTIVGHVHDRITARAMGTESTGTSVPADQTYLGVFPTAMFLGEGSTTRQDMIRSIERGVLVTEFNYCRVLDPRTVGMTGLTRNGTFIIENGAITGAVSNLRFTQSVVESLAPGAVRGIAADRTLSNSEFGVGFTHSPTVHLAEWNFTGGAAG